MIIKALGMCLVFLSCCAIGFCLGECYVSRVKELKNLYGFFELMEGELQYSVLSVKELFLSVSPRVQGVTGEMLSLLCRKLEQDYTVPDAWKYALEKKAPSMSLKKTDCDTLKSLSHLFVSYSLEEQQEHFSRLKREVEVLIKEAEESRHKNLRLVRMLGVYGGALLCIIMF